MTPAHSGTHSLELTPRTAEVLGAIRRLGGRPTLRELANELGMASTNPLREYHLGRLQNAGYVTLLPKISRGIVLTEKGRQAA